MIFQPAIACISGRTIAYYRAGKTPLRRKAATKREFLFSFNVLSKG